MKVITKTIADKIDEAINEHGKDIVRIELTCKEFKEFLECGRKFEAQSFHHTNEVEYSGSHVMYRGVCIQTHHSYYE